MNKVSDTFCILPWINLEIRTDGTTSACCNSQNRITDHAGLPFHLSQASLGEIFHSPALSQLRKSLNDGVKHPNCKVCWNREKTGMQSRRQKYNKKFEDIIHKYRDTSPQPDQPLILDLKLSRNCNLKCRICSPKSSTLWTKEFRDTNGEKELQEILNNGVSTNIDNWHSETFWASLHSWLPKIEELYFFGGEPFVFSQHEALLREAIKMGTAKHQDLKYSTNGTVIPQIFMDEIFPHFKSVNILFSIDGIGRQFEYQRYPAKWTTVWNNWQKFKSSSFECGVALAVSAINVYELPEILEFWQKQNVIPNIISVQNPPHLATTILPLPLKDKIIKHFQSHLRLSSWADQIILSICREMMSHDNSHLWPVFKSIMQKQDEYRKEKYSETFPEFYSLAGEYWK